MNSTEIITLLVIIVYVATCLLQWRRLTRGEEKKGAGTESSTRLR